MWLWGLQKDPGGKAPLKLKIAIKKHPTFLESKSKKNLSGTQIHEKPITYYIFWTGLINKSREWPRELQKGLISAKRLRIPMSDVMNQAG